MKITWFEQETPTSCVAACVRMVLNGFGQEYFESELREILGNPILGLTLLVVAQIRERSYNLSYG